MFHPRRHRVLTLLIAGVAIVGLVLLTACGEAEEDDPSAMVTVLESDERDTGRRLTNDPRAFIGDEVLVWGEIVEVVNPAAFRMTSTGDPTETFLAMGIEDVAMDLDDDMTALVRGTVHEIDEATFETDFGFGWDDSYAELEGEAAIAVAEMEVVAGDEPLPDEVDDLDDVEVEPEE